MMFQQDTDVSKHEKILLFEIFSITSSFVLSFNLALQNKTTFSNRQRNYEKLKTIWTPFYKPHDHKVLHSR